MKECITWSKFCIDPTKIEGYEKAINDESETVYACHHRYETHFEDGTLRPKPLSADLLDELGYYYHRPPYELIILTAREHTQLHQLAKGNNTYATREKAKEAELEQKKQRYQEHKEQQAEQMKQWYQANRVEELERSKRYYEEHKEQQAEYQKQWYEANKEYKKRRTKVSQWMRRNPSSTKFPKTWNKEDIKMFYELSN